MNHFKRHDHNVARPCLSAEALSVGWKCRFSGVSRDKQAGFSLIEVVLAIALMGTVLTALFGIQFNVLRSTARVSDQLSRIFILKNNMHLAMLNPDEQKKPKELGFSKTIADPATAIKYDVVSAGDKSMLKSVKDFYELRAKATWKRGPFEFTETVLSFWYRPEVKYAPPSSKPADQNTQTPQQQQNTQSAPQQAAGGKR